MSLLEVRDLMISYGSAVALRGLDFTLQEGEILALIGANGAGKSSTLRAISGLVRYGGDIRFCGESLHRLAPEKIVERGITHVPEGRGIFGNLTVHENLALGAWTRRATAADYDRVYDLFPRLAERRHQLSATLSGGEQQMLAVGRALMSRGRLMLLDEPSMGLAPILVREIFKMIEEINRAGTSILLVEQNAYMAIGVAARAYVLKSGSVAFTVKGTREERLSDPRMKDAYLGG